MKGSEAFLQLARFGISGSALTLLVSTVYFVAITITPIAPAFALTLATVIASIAGYLIHSRFSFRGFGARDATAMRFVRFIITNGLGYLLNLAFVFIMVDLAQLPKWTPIIAFCTITPLMSFTLNRNWVFR